MGEVYVYVLLGISAVALIIAAVFLVLTVRVERRVAKRSNRELW